MIETRCPHERSLITGVAEVHIDATIQQHCDDRSVTVAGCIDHGRLLDAINRKARARGFESVGGAVSPQDHDVPAASILDMARSMLRVPAFATLGEAEAYLREIYAPFGKLTDAQWRHMAVHGVVQDKAGLKLHYDPAIVERLFYAFKVLQFGVFIAWCYVHGGGFPLPARNNPFVVALALALAATGQILVVATGGTKAEAVRALVNGPEDPRWPCSFLTAHPNLTLFLE